MVVRGTLNLNLSFTLVDMKLVICLNHTFTENCFFDEILRIIKSQIESQVNFIPFEVVEFLERLDNPGQLSGI